MANTSRTRAQMKTRVSMKLGISIDPNEGDPNEVAFLEDLCFESQMEVLLRTHCKTFRGDMTLVAGVSEYYLDDRILAIDNGRGTTPSGVGPYRLITQDEMISYQAASPVGSGVQKYISFMGDLMTVAPTPDTGEVLRFWYVPKPNVFTSDSSPFSVEGDDNLRACEYYILWQLAEYDQNIGADSAQYFSDRFDKECDLIKKRMRRRGGRGLRGGLAGYPARFRTGRNDIYPE